MYLQAVCKSKSVKLKGTQLEGDRFSRYCEQLAEHPPDHISRGTHGSINYGLIRVLLFNRELRITNRYLRPLSESYMNI